MTTSASAKVPLSEKLGFGLGELGNNLFWQFFMYFQLYFYTDVYKIAPGAQAAVVAGNMFLGVKIFDALFDVAVGVMADRTNTRWGKYRPYLLWAALPFALAGLLAFTTPDLGATQKVVYAYLTYTFLMMMYSLIAIPQNSLLGVMTADPIERTVLSKYKFLFAFTAGLIVQFFTPVLVARLGAGNEALGYRYAVLCYAALALVMFFIAFVTIRERVTPPLGQKTDLAQDLRDLMGNGPWIILSLATLASVLHIAIRGGTFIYYFKYYIKDQSVDTLLFGVRHFTHGELMSAFFILGTLVTMLGTALVPQMTKAMGKRTLYAVLMGGSSLVSLAFFFVPPTDIKTIFALQILGSLTLGPTSAVLWPMYADCADFAEWKNRRRATGLIFSAAIMAQKLGWALAGFIPGYLLTYYGYAAGVDLSAHTLQGLMIVNTIIPAGCGILAIGILYFYNLDEKQLSVVTTDLNLRRQA